MSNEQKSNPSIDLRDQAEASRPAERARVEQPSRPSHSTSGSYARSSPGRVASSDGGGPFGEDTEADEYPLRHGLGSRVSDDEDVRDPIGELLRAFQEGDPEAAYSAAKLLIAEHERTLTELAKLRFKLNFGSSMCDNCDGLRAGPDVVATCFDLKQCHFKNFRRGQEDPRHLRVIQHLLRQRSVR